MPASSVFRCKDHEDPLLRQSKPDRKSTRLNSSHMSTSYAVFCLKKKNSPMRCRLEKHLKMQPSLNVRTLNLVAFFFFNDTATTEIYTLSLHDALPIWPLLRQSKAGLVSQLGQLDSLDGLQA